MPGGAASLFVVTLEDAPAPLYRGGVPGLAATSIAMTGASQYDAKTPAGVAYRQYLMTKQNAFIQRAGQALGRALRIRYRYSAALNGFAAWMTRDEAAVLRQLPGVDQVMPNVRR